MRKGPIIGLLLFLATLAGLYQMRIQLLTTAFNRALEQSDIRLLRLAGLEIGWHGLEIEELVLGVGENNARQSLRQVLLEYSLVDIRPQRLTASRVIVNLPDSSEPATDPGPLLTELIEQLLAVPLESITIDALEVKGSPLLNRPLRLQASWGDPHVSLWLQDQDKQLRLELQRTGPDQLLLTAQLSREDRPIIQFTATVFQQGDRQQLQGEGRLQLAAFVPLLASLMDLPEPLATATGELVFQLSGALHDDLSVGSVEEFLLTLSGEAIAFQFDEQSVSLGASGQLSALDCEYAETLHCSFSANSIELQAYDAWLPALAVEADVTLDRQLASINGQVYSDQGKLLFTISADYQLQTARGTGRLLADAISFDSGSNRLSRHFAHWPFEWDLYQGSVMLDVNATWRRVGEGTEIHGNISQRLEGLAGVYENIGFIGLGGDFEADFSYPDQLITTRVATLSLETLEVGVPIEDIRAHFLVDAAQQQLLLQTVEARVFGGRVWVEDAVYHAGSAHNRFDVGVDGLHLGQLLALAGYDAVEGSGRISGLLPLDVSATGVVMRRGMLAAKAPGGVLRYKAEVTADTNPSMASVIEALSNYQYNIFQLEADYLESGDLVLEVLLRGHNPDYEQGRPIHLNLNITDNIPVLLKSLQAGRVIADTISKKLGGS